MEKSNPIILIHGLWNTSSIFSSITSKLDDIGVEYFAPTLKHSYGMTSILDLTYKYFLKGDGNVVDDFSSGKATFTHKDL